MLAGGRLKRPFSGRIVASAVLSVALAGLLVTLAALGVRPAIRTAMVRHMATTMDLDACRSDPASWGVTRGAMAVHAYDRSGRSSNPAAPAMEPGLLNRALRSERGVLHDPDPETSVAVLPVGPDGPCAVVRVQGRPPDGVALQEFLTVLVVTVVGGMVLAAAGTLVFVVWPLRERIAALSEAASGVGSARFSVPEQRTDALGHIAEMLLESHARIVDTQEALHRRNRALEDHLAGIAHDLRTPLASMQLSLEAMAGEAGGHARDAPRRALSDVVYLSSLVENLHQGTRLRQDVDVVGGPVELGELVARVVGRFTIVGRHAGVEVASSVPDEPLWVACTPALAERAVANLVQNAVEHNGEGGHVAVILAPSADGARFELTVTDDGPGLPHEVLASLSSETFLTDEARRRGPGLGMLITSEIARRAGWSLSYEAGEPAGLRVSLAGPTAFPP